MATLAITDSATTPHGTGRVKRMAEPHAIQRAFDLRSALARALFRGVLYCVPDRIAARPTHAAFVTISITSSRMAYLAYRYGAGRLGIAISRSYRFTRRLFMRAANGSGVVTQRRALAEPRP
jgi:hypothetical protein